jgi:Mrp family chromosome partitioning ATPase
MAALHVLHHPNSDFTQSVFTLKHVIEQAEPTNGSKLVAIVSPRGGDGKTTVATNLARYAASAGLKTLLADTDLRTAMASQRVHPGAIGVGPSTLQDVAARLKNAVVKDPRSPLMLYPATETRHAMARPADILASRSFPSLVRRMREEYEFVVFDTPGALDFPDARLLVRLVDWIVVVVHAGQTSREDLERLLKECAVDQWNGAPGKVLGLVVNHGPRVVEHAETAAVVPATLKRFINGSQGWPPASEAATVGSARSEVPVEQRSAS